MTKEKLVCQDCGTDDANKNIRETYCPYAEEIHNKEIAIVVCQDCYKERLWDI